MKRKPCSSTVQHKKNGRIIYSDKHQKIFSFLKPLVRLSDCPLKLDTVAVVRHLDRGVKSEERRFKETRVHLSAQT